MSKIQRLMRPLMQSLCPPRWHRLAAAPRPTAPCTLPGLPGLSAQRLQPVRRALHAALGLGLAGAAALAGATAPGLAGTATSASASASQAVVRWPQAASPEQALAQVVGQWLAATQGLDPAGIRLMPLDARLQIRPCEAGLGFELPFASRETVRVRCEAPAWQLFVRLQPDSPALLAQAAAAPAGASAPPPATRQVVVAAGLLQRGTRLSAAQLTLAEVPAQNLPANVIERVDDVLHSELLRDLPAGTPLRSQDLRPAMMVKRGQMVMLTVGAKTGFKVSARLEALQDGRMGEQIKLKNRESGRIVSAVVTGLNSADGL